MKTQKAILLPVVALAACALFFLAGRTGERAIITINGTEYVMCSFTVREFMADGFELMSPLDVSPHVNLPNYNQVSLEAKTYYNSGVGMRPAGGSGDPVDVWVYNPDSSPVELRDGKVCSISCEIDSLRDVGLAVEVAGLELKGQSREEIAAWMSDAFKGYEYIESSDANAFSYRKGNITYTFVFNDSGLLSKAIVRQSVSSKRA